MTNPKVKSENEEPPILFKVRSGPRGINFCRKLPTITPNALPKTMPPINTEVEIDTRCVSIDVEAQ